MPSGAPPHHPNETQRRGENNGGVREQAATIGLDIAEHVFQLHGMDVAGHVLFRKRLAIRAGAWQP